MMTNAVLAAVHYLALAIGFSGICLRAKALADARAGQSLKSIYFGDNLWGIAALLWIATGLLRAFGGFEKGTAFYLESTGFWIKMALFLGVFILELPQMITLIRWRMAGKTEVAPEHVSALKRFTRFSRVQIGLTLLIPLVASLMARGIL